MWNDPAAFRELFELARSLGLVARPADNLLQGELIAPGQPRIQCRHAARADGNWEVALVLIEQSDSGRPVPNPLVKMDIYPTMAAAEVRQLVHNGDYVLDCYRRQGTVRPMAMRLALAYTRRWFRQLAERGYRYHSSESRSGRGFHGRFDTRRAASAR